MNKHFHLAPCAYGQLDLSQNPRIRAVLAERFLGHERLLSLLSRINELVHLPQQDSACGMVTCGIRESGKTVLAKRLAERYRPSSRSDDGVMPSADLNVGMSGISRPETLLRRLLSFSPRPQERRDAQKELEGEVARCLVGSGARLMVVGNVESLTDLRKTQRGAVLLALAALMAKSHLPVILLTTPHGRSAVQECRQVHAGMTYETLPTWNAGAYLADLLAGLERTLPLRKASDLARSEAMEALVRGSGGSLGAMVDIVRVAAAEAIATGAERITVGLIEQASADRSRGRWLETMVA